MSQKAVNSDKFLNLGYRVRHCFDVVAMSSIRQVCLLLDGLCLYIQVLMKRNSTYIAFVLAGALIGERVSILQNVWSDQLHEGALQL